MPSTGQRRKSAAPIATESKHEVLEDLELKPERAPRNFTKEVPVSKLVSSTLTDRLSATLAYAISNNMVGTVEKEYAITPVEAYNLIHPASNIILHYLPTTTIKTKLPADVADNVEKIIVTFLEYTSRVMATFVQKRFDKRLEQHGMTLRDEGRPTAPIKQPKQTPVMSADEIAEMIGDASMPVDDENIDTQVRPGRTGTDLGELVVNGVITGDLGQAM